MISNINYEYKDIINQSLEIISSYYSLDKIVKPREVTKLPRQPDSVVFKFKFNNKDINLKGIILKIKNKSKYPPNILEQEVKTLREINEKFAIEKHLHVPKVVGFIPEKGAILTEEIEGDSLYNFFVNSTTLISRFFMLKKLVYAAGLAARALNIVHEEVKDVAFKIIERDLEICQAKLKKLKEIIPVNFNNQFCEEMLDTLQKYASKFKSTKIVWLHRDFSPVNMIFNKDDLYILDWTFADFGFYFEDISRFWQTLENIKAAYPFRKKIFSMIQANFLNNYKDKIDVAGPEFIFYRIKDAINNLLAYKYAVIENVYYAKIIYNLYYQPQLKILKNLVENKDGGRLYANQF